MTRKVLGLLLLTLLTVLVISCGDSEQVLRINTWENPSTSEALTALNARFMEEFPDITIELTTSPTAQFDQSNPARIQAVDVDIWSGFGFAQKIQDFHGDVEPGGQYQNILAGQVASLTGESFLANYNQDAVDQFMTYNGEVYGVCMGSVVISGIYWNKTLFAELGIDEPDTYDELVAAAETLEANGYIAFTAGGGPVWPINMIHYGFIGSFFDDANELERSLWTGGDGYRDPRYVESVARYQNLLLNYYEAGFQTIEYNPHLGRFAAGNIGMMADGIWQANGIAAAIEEAGTGFEFGYMQVPASDNAADNEAYVGKGDLMWFVHDKSDMKEAAIQWLEFMSRPENYEEFINIVGWLPTQPVPVENEILDHVNQFPIKLAYEQIRIGRPTQGQYADASITHLAPMGTIETVDEMIDAAMADWEAAE